MGNCPTAAARQLSTRASANGLGESWIGAGDSAVEGEWTWDDGVLFWIGDENGAVVSGQYAAWLNNRDEDCAMLRPGSVGWFDDNCGETNDYICERGE